MPEPKNNFTTGNQQDATVPPVIPSMPGYRSARKKQGTEEYTPPPIPPKSTSEDGEAVYTCVDILIGGIEGHEIIQFNSFTLKQSTTTHHTFELVIPYMGLEKGEDIDGGDSKGEDHWMKKARNLLGKSFSAGYYYHTKKESKRWFHGVVTNVSFRRAARSFGDIVITGGSPTLLMDSLPHTQSFTGMNLPSIVNTLWHQAGLDEKYCNAAPKYEGTLSYTCQSNETHYNYMARLAACYGEKMFYDGEIFHFGEYNPAPAIILIVERNVWHIEACMNTMHVNPVHYAYSSSDHEELLPASPSIRGMETLGKIALDVSRELYKTKAVQVAPIRAVFSEEVTLTQKSLTEARAAELFTVTATTSNPYLFPGCIVTMEILVDPKAEKTEHFAQLVVTEMNQHLSPTGAYECTFSAVSAYTEHLPLPQFVMSSAEPQIATVVDNADPAGQGRVKVQFPWQEKPTDFLRVMTPDAGSSDKVGKNRGQVFIPEKGDQVLVGFLHGHPDRPYVMGSMFHGKNGAGGFANNHLKTIKTRSGHSIELDDAPDSWSITIKDEQGNVIRMDTKGKNIEITAPETMTFNAKNMHINVAENLTTNIGKDSTTVIGNNMLLSATNNINMYSSSTFVNAVKVLDLFGGKQLIAYTEGQTEFGAKEQMHVYGGNSLITAKDRIDYKAPKMEKLAQKGKFEYTKEPAIVSVDWMNNDFQKQVEDLLNGDKASVLVQTRNMTEGEEVEVTIEEEVSQDETKQHLLKGTVNTQGIAELKEVFLFEESAVSIQNEETTTEHKGSYNILG